MFTLLYHFFRWSSFVWKKWTKHNKKLLGWQNSKLKYILR